MAEFPALPLFTDAYLGDTTHLTTIEHGAYLLLLMTAWRSRDCKLPDDDRMLARYTKMTLAQWQRIKPIIEPFFVVTSDGWTQRRLTDEANHVRQVRESQSKNGKASALKRKGRHVTTVEPSPSQASTTTPSPTPISNSEDKSSSLPRKREQPHPFPCPAGVQQQHWDDFMLIRKRKGCVRTLSAYMAILRNLSDFATAEWPPGRLVQKSAENNWAKIIDPNEHSRDGRNGSAQRSENNRNGTSGKADGFTAALREARGFLGDHPADDPGGSASFAGMG